MDSLIQSLMACEALLVSVGEEFWACKIREVLGKGKDSIDLYVLEDILSWYGGMGSFSDLVISRYNDHLVDGSNEYEINTKLSKLRSDIYKEAKTLI